MTLISLTVFILFFWICGIIISAAAGLWVHSCIQTYRQDKLWWYDIPLSITALVGWSALITWWLYSLVSWTPHCVFRY